MNRCPIINQYVKPYSDPPRGIRQSGRGLVVKDGMILLSHEVNTEVYMSPGGGLEVGETLEECCARELLEETGYTVKVIEPFVTVNEYCFETLFVSNYFICEAVGRGEQRLTDVEVAHGIVPEWISVDAALEIFGEYKLSLIHI